MTRPEDATLEDYEEVGGGGVWERGVQAWLWVNFYVAAVQCMRCVRRRGGRRHEYCHHHKHSPSHHPVIQVSIESFGRGLMR